MGNIVNRVFDSSGPEGKVRGTPQQIIEKYNQLARDAQLSNDRVAAENFQQHAEHYLRLLSEAQREQEARREQQEREQEARREQQERDREQRRDRQQQDHDAAAAAVAGEGPQPDVVEVPQSDGADTGLVETPESKPARPRRGRKPKNPGPEAPGAEAAPSGDGPGTPETPEAAE